MLQIEASKPLEEIQKRRNEGGGGYQVILPATEAASLSSWPSQLDASNMFDPIWLGAKLR